MAHAYRHRTPCAGHATRAPSLVSIVMGVVAARGFFELHVSLLGGAIVRLAIAGAIL
jgi:hypothetical protein